MKVPQKKKKEKQSHSKIACSECGNEKAVRPEIYQKRVEKFGSEQKMKDNYLCLECRAKRKPKKEKVKKSKDKKAKQPKKEKVNDTPEKEDDEEEEEEEESSTEDESEDSDES